MRDPLSPPFHVNLIYGLRFFQVTVLCPFLDRQEPLVARSIPPCFEASPVVAKPPRRNVQTAGDYEVILTEPARDDLSEIVAFIAQDNPQAVTFRDRSIAEAITAV